MALKTIHLHGLLAEKFGPVHKLHVDSVQEAGRALAVVLPGFRDEVRDKYYKVRLGPIELDEREIGIRIGDVHEVHIIPALEGSGGRGTTKILIGALIVGAVVATGGSAGIFAAGGAGFGATIGATGITYGSVALFGAAIALAGVSQMLAPSVETPKESKSKDQKT